MTRYFARLLAAAPGISLVLGLFLAAAFLEGCSDSAPAKTPKPVEEGCSVSTLSIVQNFTKPCDQSKNPETLNVEQQISLELTTKESVTLDVYLHTGSGSESWRLKPQGGLRSLNDELDQIVLEKNGQAGSEICLILTKVNSSTFTPTAFALPGVIGAASACPTCKDAPSTVLNAWTFVTNTVQSFSKCPKLPLTPSPAPPASLALLAAAEAAPLAAAETPKFLSSPGRGGKFEEEQRCGTCQAYIQAKEKKAPLVPPCGTPEVPCLGLNCSTGGYEGWCRCNTCEEYIEGMGQGSPCSSPNNLCIGTSCEGKTYDQFCGQNQKQLVV